MYGKEKFDFRRIAECKSQYEPRVQNANAVKRSTQETCKKTAARFWLVW
jgi:hypothetical protein